MSPADPTAALTIRDTAQGAVLAVLVQPRAAREKVVGVHDARLKLQLTAPPVEGAANEAARRFLAKLTGIPRSVISLKAGASDRRKSFLFAGLPAADLRQTLAACASRGWRP